MSAEVSKESVLEALLSTIKEFNQGRSASARLDASPQTPLFGDGAQIDSLGFVNLVLIAEERLSVVFGVRVPLAEMMMAEGDSQAPATVDALADRVLDLLADKSHG